MEKRIKGYFQAHPNVDVMYFTADGLAFIDKSRAEGHAQNLAKDKRVIKEVERKEVEQVAKAKRAVGTKTTAGKAANKGGRGVGKVPVDPAKEDGEETEGEESEINQTEE